MEIKKYEKNAKIHDKKQIELLAKIVKEFGWRQPILVNQQGVIIAGHGRWITYEQFKDKYSLKDVWVIDDTGKKVMGEPESTPMTEQQEMAYRLADNQVNAMTGMDMKLVVPELKMLEPEILDLTGFDKDLIIEPEEKDDEVPDVPAEPQSKLGDLYILGNHRVLCGDSTKIEDVERLMDGNKADLVVTDPPYNVNYEGGTGLKIENDDMDDSTFCTFLTDAFKRFSESMKLGASFYIWHADLEGFNFRKACKDSGLIVRQCIIWNKNSLVMGRQDYQWKHEPCLYGWRDGATHSWYGDRDKTTVLNFDKPRKNGEHPTMKPVELLIHQVVNSSKQEDVVLDLFLGSGSTLIASEKTGRICYGMELDPKYIDVIVERYCEYTGNRNIIKNGEQIIWQRDK